MNKKIKLFAPFTIFALTLFTGGGAALADFSAINDHTGYDSENEVEASGEGEFIISNFNTELIANIAGGLSNTGDNESEENTGDGEVESGGLEVQGEFENEVNLNISEESEVWWEGDFMAINDTTGADSDNDAEAELENLLLVENINEIGIENLAELELNTGDNEVEENTGDGSLETGDIDVEIAETNTANGNLLDFGDIGNSSFSAIAQNLITGADSDNEAEAEVENEIELSNENLSDVFNGVFVAASTGNNEVEENTGDVDFETGDAMAEVEIANDVNINETDVAFGGDGEVEARNETTGADSDNDAEAEIESNVAVSNLNAAGIENLVEIELNTGDNEIEENTGDADGETGDVEASVLIENGSTLNWNSTAIDIGFGDVVISAFNDTTGADSDNEAEAEVETNVSVENINEAGISNIVGLDLNTGDNEVEENTGDASLSTGDAEASVDISTDVNMNSTEINFNPNSEINVGNSMTGADSDNEASAEISNTIEVVNENVAEICNVVEISSNTGGNDVSENTGSGSVSSGDSSFSFSFSNTANGNSTEVGN